MNNFNVDLTNCDREPIHIPGKIQSQGFLIAVNSSTNRISFVSENVSQFLKISPAKLLELPISDLSEKIGVSDQNVDFNQLLRLGRVRTVLRLLILTNYRLTVSHFILSYTHQNIILYLNSSR